MNPVPEILPITDMRHHQSELLDKVRSGPVVLTQFGRPVVVMVDPEQWNRLIECLEDQDDALAAWQARWELASGEDDVVAWDSVKAEMDGAPN